MLSLRFGWALVNSFLWAPFLPIPLWLSCIYYTYGSGRGETSRPKRLGSWLVVQRSGWHLALSTHVHYQAVAVTTSKYRGLEAFAEQLMQWAQAFPGHETNTKPRSLLPASSHSHRPPSKVAALSFSWRGTIVHQKPLNWTFESSPSVNKAGWIKSRSQEPYSALFQRGSDSIASLALSFSHSDSAIKKPTRSRKVPLCAPLRVVYLTSKPGLKSVRFWVKSRFQMFPVRFFGFCTKFVLTLWSSPTTLRQHRYYLINPLPNNTLFSSPSCRTMKSLLNTSPNFLLENLWPTNFCVVTATTLVTFTKTFHTTIPSLAKKVKKKSYWPKIQPSQTRTASHLQLCSGSAPWRRHSKAHDGPMPELKILLTRMAGTAHGTKANAVSFPILKTFWPGFCSSTAQLPTQNAMFLFRFDFRFCLVHMIPSANSCRNYFCLVGVVLCSYRS